MIRRLVAPLTFLFLASLATSQCTITFVHTNDLHSHADPTTVKGHKLGGYAKQATVLLKLRDSETNPVFLNGGDTFQGTLYFNTYEGLADLAFMNVVGYQAAAVGNHDFDHGPSALATFAKNARFPLLAANLDVSKEPLLKDWVKPATVIEVGGEKLGVVGAITPDLPNISSPGDLVVMKDLEPSIQAAVNGLRKDGINKVVLLTHCGYDLEQKLAREIKGIDVVVGGHSHTLLGDPGLSGIKGEGAYPTVVKSNDGRTVLVVQAWEWGKVVGRLKVDFDKDGNVVTWDGQVIPITDDIPDNPYVSELYAAFNKPISALKGSPVGAVTQDLTRDPEGGHDSTMGDLMADSMLEATSRFGSVAAFTNAGGVRAGMAKGKVTYGDAIQVEPFGNTLVVIELSGAELQSAIEEGLETGGMLYPSSGTTYNYDMSKSPGSRVSDLTVGGKPVDLAATYKLTFNNFTVGGGDKHVTLANAKGTRTNTGLVDLDALIDFVKAHSPVAAGADRIHKG